MLYIFVFLVKVNLNERRPIHNNYYDFLQEIAHLLYAVLTAQVHSTFHKINVHAALTPSDIGAHFKPAFEQARHLKQAFDKQTKATPSRGSAIRTPFVTVCIPYSIKLAITCIRCCRFFWMK